jgi:outer membrane autotransporter protein
MEVGGTAPGQSDQLIITGNATLGGKLVVKAINGFAPKQGDTFDFIRIGGTASDTFSQIEIQNLAPGFQYDVATNGGKVTLTALNDGFFVPPLQNAIEAEAVSIGGVIYVVYRVTLNNTVRSRAAEGPAGAGGFSVHADVGYHSAERCLHRGDHGRH